LTWPFLHFEINSVGGLLQIEYFSLSFALLYLFMVSFDWSDWMAPNVSEKVVNLLWRFDSYLLDFLYFSYGFVFLLLFRLFRSGVIILFVDLVFGSVAGVGFFRVLI